MIEFKEGFLWGGAMSAEQTEGNRNGIKGETIWDHHFKKMPNDFFDKVGPDLTSNFYKNYKEDINLFKEVGINSIRIGISWTRLFPNGKDLNKEGVKFYHNVLDLLLHKNIKPIITLFHFDMPMWAHKKGSWPNDEVVENFVNFCSFVFKEYGNKVKYFVTFNEPIVPVWAGYQSKHYWPGIVDNQRATDEMVAIIYAHARVVQIFQKLNLKNSKIGVVVNVSSAYPIDGINYSKDDVKAARMFNLLHNYSVLDPMVKGRIPKGLKGVLNKIGVEIRISKSKIKIIKKVKIDFLGVNYYSPTRVKTTKKQGDTIFSKLYEIYSWDKARMNIFRGWEIYPKGIYDVAIIVKNRYKNIPFYIAENGMGVEGEEKFRDKNNIINDSYRIAFMKEHLEELNKAIKKGANCFGYHVWSIMDNWSWKNAYKNRYGFIEVNLKDQSRKLKKSAIWFKELTEKNNFDDNYVKVDKLIDLKNKV